MYTFPRRVAYAKLTSSVVISTIGSILAVNMTELLRINVPSLPVPVQIQGKATFQNTATGGSTNGNPYLGVAPAGAAGAAVAALASVDVMGVRCVGTAAAGGAGTTFEPPGRRCFVSFWLPENSGGDYILGAWRETSSDAVSMVANAFTPCELWAVRG